MSVNTRPDIPPPHVDVNDHPDGVDHCATLEGIILSEHFEYARLEFALFACIRHGHEHYEWWSQTVAEFIIRAYFDPKSVLPFPTLRRDRPSAKDKPLPFTGPPAYVYRKSGPNPALMHTPPRTPAQWAATGASVR